MPSLPSNGDTNWGTTLNNFLQVSHDADGSLSNTALQNAGVVQSSGINRISEIVVLSQAAYDALTPDNNTLYIIT